MSDCPYCPYLINIMIKDERLDTSALYFNQILHKIPQFILRRKKEVKKFIEAFEKGDPALLKNE